MICKLEQLLALLSHCGSIYFDDFMIRLSFGSKYLTVIKIRSISYGIVLYVIF